MNSEQIDPLTAPIEQVLGTSTPPPEVPGTPVAPATPLEFKTGTVYYGGGGPVPVPPLEQARRDSTDTEEPEVEGDTEESTDEQEAGPAVGAACWCGRYEVVNPASGQVEEVTGCTSTTRNLNSKFAPGHDARFKGLLIRAGERDWRVREVGTDTLRRSTTVAARVSSAMARRVEEGIKRRKR